MANLNFKIYTLGCKVNQYDSFFLARQLAKLGWRPTLKNSQAAIVNTCAVTKTAIYKSKRMLKKARRENPSAKIVLLGCWPQVYSLKAKEINVDLLWGTGKLTALADKINDLWGVKNVLVNQSLAPTLFFNKTRYIIKIQDGCEQFCTYCLIPFTRGRLASRDQAEIIAEVQAAAQAGWQEVILSGIHLGWWGKEKVEPQNLTSLLRRLLELKLPLRFRLSSIEITEISDELIQLIAENKNICPHLHIPLQSANDRILKLMNRPYKQKFFSQRLKFIRQQIPQIAITTDVIVGFPSETKAEFLETYNFVRQARFSRLHVFPFSAHQQTPAAKFAGQIKKAVKQQRASLLRRLGKELEKKYFQQFKGQEITVLVEQAKKGRFVGRSEYYFSVEFSARQIKAKSKKRLLADKLAGQLIKIKL